jgi:ATP-dependent Lon protease
VWIRDRVGTENPLVLIDEIDKRLWDRWGSHQLDPEQNNGFVDY